MNTQNTTLSSVSDDQQERIAKLNRHMDYIASAYRHYDRGHCRGEYSHIGPIAYRTAHARVLLLGHPFVEDPSVWQCLDKVFGSFVMNIDVFEDVPPPPVENHPGSPFGFGNQSRAMPMLYSNTPPSQREYGVGDKVKITFDVVYQVYHTPSFRLFVDLLSDYLRDTPEEGRTCTILESVAHQYPMHRDLVQPIGGKVIRLDTARMENAKHPGQTHSCITLSGTCIKVIDTDDLPQYEDKLRSANERYLQLWPGLAAILAEQSDEKDE